MATDIDPDFEELKENRFAHLLKPIRDLQDNFNVDLAHELEEYLDQLENAQFTFEGARHVMVDFAEAALLIQGSTVVFSKKVEYLYNLTYQALEAVKGRRRPDGQPLDGDGAGQLAAGARGRGAAAARAADQDEDDDLERFWDTEDFLKEMTDLDLAPDEGAMPNAGMAVRPPAALLALEEHGTGGAGGGSGAKGDGDAGVYRLQQCIVHCSGALLLDPRDGDMYDIHLRFIGPQPRQDKGLEQLIDAHRMEHPKQLNSQPVTQPGPPGQQAVAGDADGVAPMDMDPGQAQDFDNDDGGGYGGGGDWPSDDEGAPPTAHEDAAGADPIAAKAAASGATTNGVATAEYADGRPRRQAPSLAGVGTASVGDGQQADGEAEEEEEEEVFDPYKPLDPNVKSRLPDRPLVVRKPRKALRSSGKAASVQGAGGLAAAAGAAGLMLPEFSYCLAFLRPAHAAKEEGPAKCPHTTQKNRQERVARAQDVPAPVFDARDAAAAAAADEAAAADPADDAAEPQAEQPYGFDDDDDGGGFGGGGGSDLDDDVDPAAVGPNGFGGDGGDWHNPAGDPGAGAWPANRELFPGMVPPMGRLSGSEEPLGTDGEEPSYEELCRSHMESMLLAAAAREVQTDLARRVSGWRQRIDPLLKAEESRPAFDIQDYGELIISRLSGLEISDGNPQGEPQQQQQAVAAAGPRGARLHVNFSKVAKDLKKFEVSRMFSAMLQLINNRNVAIYKADSSRVPPGEVPDEPFQLELLSKDMYHKSMGARLAAPAGGGALPAAEDADGGEREDGENRGATQPGRRAGGGRGKQGGAAKRAKRAAAEPLGDVNMEA